MQNKYCITHEKVESTFFDRSGLEFHFINNAPAVCEGPFAYSPPPELPKGWELVIEEPSMDELIVINTTARQLWLELEGA